MNSLGGLLAWSHVEHKARSKSVEPIACEVLSVSEKEERRKWRLLSQSMVCSLYNQSNQ